MIDGILIIIIILFIIATYIVFFYKKDEPFENLVSLQSQNLSSIQTNINPEPHTLMANIVVRQNINGTTNVNDPPQLQYQNEQSDYLKHYSELAAKSNGDLTYYHNDVIDQSKYSSDANDIINQTNKINYYDVETGIQKCKKSCSGTCYEFGWTGDATCYPIKNDNYGTFYKNPAFINSLNPNPQNDIILTRPQ